MAKLSNKKRPWSRWPLYAYLCSLSLLSIRWESLGESVLGSVFSISRIVSPILVLCAIFDYKNCFTVIDKRVILLLIFITLGVFWDFVFIPYYRISFIDSVKPFLWVSIFTIILNLTRCPKIKKNCISCLAISGLLFSLFQFLNLSVRKVDLVAKGGLGLAYERGAGAGADANFATIFLGVSIMAAAFIFFDKRNGYFLKIIAVFTAMICFAAAYQLVSRGGLFAVLAGLCSIGICLKGAVSKILGFTFLLICLAGLVWILAQNEFLVYRMQASYYDSDTSGRGAIWLLALDVCAQAKYMFFGAGFFNGMIELGSRMGRPYFSPHNSYIWALQSTGIVGFGLAAMIISGIIFSAVKNRFNGNEGFFNIGCLTIMLVGSLGIDLHITIVFWVVFAMASNVEYKLRNE